jgi:two-component system phosphate regulon response regulator PhoB
MKRILAIEDERDLAELIAFNLTREGYEVVTAPDGLSGLESALTYSPDLILLDLMLPVMGGFEVCRRLKSSPATASIPVIFLTAKGEDVDKVVGFEMGGDDYVVKPFSFRELLLRIRAVLRRSSPEPAASTVVSIGVLSIDTAGHTLTVRGQEVSLTAIEFKLLCTLAERAGRLQSRDQLLNDVWGYSYLGDTRTVDTHITRLRTKLGEAGEMIKTVRGFGYKLEAP